MLPQMSEASDNREIIFNGLFAAVEPAALYGFDYENTTGLILAYFGGEFNGNTIAAGDVTLTDNATNYVVAHRTTGVVSDSTVITNYNDQTTYMRLYIATTVAGAITVLADKRQSYGGTGGGGSVTDFTDLGDVPASYTGEALKVVRVNAGETGLEFANAAGDASTNTATSVDSEIALFSSTTGKLLKRATGTGYAKATSGVFSVDSTATVRTDLQGTGLVAGEVGFRNIPQNSQSTAYTTVAADAGKHILHPLADNNPRTFTIDSNANVAYPIGTAITFINEINTVTIAITSDTMKFVGAGSTGSRTLAANGIATAVKTDTTTWWISGTNLT